MMTTRFFGYENYAAYRAAFKSGAAKRGIDSAIGATSYQVVSLNAEVRQQTHFERATAAFWANARLESAWWRYGGDRGRMAMQADRNWWKYEDYWHGRCAATTRPIKVPLQLIALHGVQSPTDVDALYAIRSAIRYEQRHAANRPASLQKQPQLV